MSLHAFAACIAAVPPCFTAEARPDTRRLDARLAEIVEAEGAVGASVAVADAQGEIYARGFGHATGLRDRRPVRTRPCGPDRCPS